MDFNQNKNCRKSEQFLPEGKACSSILPYKKKKGRWKKSRGNYHCVFVKRQLKLKENAYKCVNSWGNSEPFPVVEQDRTGNMLWLVEADWEPAPKGLFPC